MQVTSGAPDADDAKQYHEISLRALRCSRDTLSQKYAHCLAELRSSSPPPGLPAPEPPKVEKASWMGWSKEAVDACPEMILSKGPASLTGAARRASCVLRDRAAAVCSARTTLARACVR